MLQKSENIKDHPIDYSTGVTIVIDNNYNFHRNLDSECVAFTIFACLVVFINFMIFRTVNHNAKQWFFTNKSMPGTMRANSKITLHYKMHQAGRHHDRCHAENN